MTRSGSFSRSVRAASLLMLTISAEVTGNYLALLCLSRDHNPWLWLVVALDTCLFLLLLKLQRFASKKIFAIYGAICFAAAGAWFWLVRSVVITAGDWWGLAIVLFAVGAISALRLPK